MPVSSFAASDSVELYVPADNLNGVVFIAAQSGTYRFAYAGGSYGPELVDIGDSVAIERWKTRVLFFKNRPVEYQPVEIAQRDHLPIVNFDYSLGSDTLYPSFEEACEMAAGGYVDIPLEANDYVSIVVNDAGQPQANASDIWFRQNVGGVNIRATLPGSGASPIGVRAVGGLDYTSSGIFPYSNEYGMISVSARDEEGTTVRANTTGTYIFFIPQDGGGGQSEKMITTCAYRTLPADAPGQAGWNTGMAVFKNRPVTFINGSMAEPDYIIGKMEGRSSFNDPVGNFSMASFIFMIFNSGLEGYSLFIPLEKNDTLTFVCVDEAGAYGDNEGGLTIKTLNQGTSLSIVENTAVPVAAVVTGVTVSILGLFLAKLWNFTVNGLKSYATRWISVKEVKARGIVASPKKPLILSLSKKELVIGSIGALILGVSFMYAEKLPWILYYVLIYVIIVGITVVIHELAHMHMAYKFKTDTELKFWSVGTFSLLVTTSLFGIVFGQPIRTIINDQDKLGKRKVALISLAGPIASVAIILIFIAITFAGGIFADIGFKGIPVCMVSIVYSLMPFEPMEGKRIFNWSKLVWAVLFFPLMFTYIGILVYYAINMI